MSTLTAEAGNSAARELRVGEWLVDPKRNEVRRGEETVRLEPKVIEVLVYLAREAGEVVAREELLSGVWPGVVVGDDALTQAIIKLRKALGDDAHRPTYIETISKRGYRLIAPVEQAGKPMATAQAPRGSFLRRNRLVVATAIGVLLISVGALLVFPEMARTVGMQWPIVMDTRGGVTAPSRPIIAVLPLSNLSGDPKRDYFSDGVTEDIIDALGRFSALRVMSRNSVQPFKERAPVAQEIRELGARYVVKGSVREADGKLRVAVELSDTDKGTVLWSERYDGEGKEVFEMQDRIVRSIVGALAVKLTRLEQERAFSKPVGNMEAYDLVLQARALYHRMTREENRQARALLAKAVQIEPNYAEAYVVLAQAEQLRADYGWVERQDKALASAEAYARRALSIEDTGAHSRAHGILARIYSRRGDGDRALAEADRAIELNPSDSIALRARGEQLILLGRIDEGIATLETARRYVGSGFFSNALTQGYYLSGRYREALEHADLLIALNPDEKRFFYANRAATLAQMGRAEEAREALAQMHRMNPFATVETYATRYRNPEHTAKLQEGLRKAGLD